LRSLSHGFTKYLERHSEIYERDIQRVGELFTKLHLVAQVDAVTPGKFCNNGFLEMLDCF
jgi:hypothetical protein